MTSFERAPWWALCIFFVGHWILRICSLFPVVITRGEYERLRDNDHTIKYALRALDENRRLREQLAQKTAEEK